MLLKKIYRKIFTKKKYDDSITLQFIGSAQPKVDIGKHTYMNGVKLYCWDNRFQLNIGKYCSMADDISIIAGGEHDKDWVSTYPFIDRWNLNEYNHLKHPRYKGNISIENDVWIANGVTILSGVKIGNGAIIGACTVVSKDVPPYAIAIGNPMRILKFRFSKETIEALLDIKWWDWTESKIISNQELFTKPENFIKELKK